MLITFPQLPIRAKNKELQSVFLPINLPQNTEKQSFTEIPLSRGVRGVY